MARVVGMSAQNASPDRASLWVIVPFAVAVIGTDVVSPALGRFKWRRHKVTVKIGKPIDFSRFEGMGGNRFVERAVTDEVMYELMQMSGQEYVDIYGASLKKAPAVEKAAADRVPDTRAG